MNAVLEQAKARHAERDATFAAMTQALDVLMGPPLDAKPVNNALRSKLIVSYREDQLSDVEIAVSFMQLEWNQFNFTQKDSSIVIEWGIL